MTYREFINALDDEEFSECILADSILHMACKCSIVDNKPVCPYESKNCLKCIQNLLASEIEDLNAI